MASASYMRERRNIARERGLKGVAARKRKMRERASAADEVGRVVFDGDVFGGRHVLRLLFCENYDRDRLMLEIDGKASRARSVRGVLKMLARRVANEI